MSNALFDPAPDFDQQNTQAVEDPGEIVNTFTGIRSKS